MSKDVVIVAAACTAPCGSFGGSLADARAQTGATVVKTCSAHRPEAGPDRRGDPRPGADRGFWPEPGTADGDRGRPVAGNPGDDDQQRSAAAA